MQESLLVQCLRMLFQDSSQPLSRGSWHKQVTKTRFKVKPRYGSIFAPVYRLFPPGFQPASGIRIPLLLSCLFHANFVLYQRIILLRTNVPQTAEYSMLTRYIEEAMKQALYEKLDDGTYWGEIPICPGTNGHAHTLSECQQELREVVEEWVLQNLHDDVPLPVIAGLDLNKHEVHAPSSNQA